MKIIGQLKAILGLDKSRFDKGFDDAEKKTSKFNSGMKKLAGIMAAAFGIGILINFGKQLIGLASKVEGVRTAFERLGDPTLLEQLRTATRGTVTDLQLMQKAVQAKNFKIPLSQLATYFEFATKRAIQTGESVDYLVDSIITGIGRKSVLVMDNLGISAVELQNEVKKTGDFGIAAGNIIRRELESMGTVAETTAIKIASIKTAWENLKTSLGEAIIGSDKLQSLLDWAKTMIEILNDPHLTDWQKFRMTPEKYKRYKELYVDMYSGGESKGGPLAAGIVEKQVETIADLRAKLEDLKKQVEDTRGSEDARGRGLLEQIKITEDLIKKLTTLEEVLVRVEGISKVKAPALTGITGLPTEGIQPFGGISAETGQIDEMTEALYEQQTAVAILSNAFETLFTSTEDGFKAMIDSIIAGLKRLIAELLARAAVLTILNIVTGGFSGALKGVFKGAAASMGFTKGASGGTVPSGYPHDTFPAMLSSGETVLTARQSRDFNRSINIHVTGEIAGRVIALQGRRTEEEN